MVYSVLRPNPNSLTSLNPTSGCAHARAGLPFVAWNVEWTRVGRQDIDAPAGLPLDSEPDLGGRTVLQRAWVRRPSTGSQRMPRIQPISPVRPDSLYFASPHLTSDISHLT
jgi:hypothetical protein